MSQEKLPIPRSPKKEGDAEKPLKRPTASKPLEVEFVTMRADKPMTAEAMLAEMKKQGLRPATIEEAMTFVEQQTANIKEGDATRIEPKESDITAEYSEIPEHKKLPKPPEE